MDAVTRRVDAEDLEKFIAVLFEKAGASGKDARLIAEVLVWANLRGVDSHGALRVPGYLRRIATGEFNPRPDIKVITDLPGAAIIDADRAYGPVGMTRAMDIAMDKARVCGIGAAFVRRITHMAAIGHYALRAAAADMLGVVIGTSRPNMAYHGARRAGVATSPIAIAVPGLNHPPLMLDMATAIASVGKLMLARDMGRPLADGWALDRSGSPTIDPHQGVLPMPLGGPKGAGLSLLFECLTGLLVANPLIAPAIGPSKETAHSQNAMALAIDIAAFIDPALYRRDVDDLIATLKMLPAADGHDEILVPGERGDRVLAERRRTGIPLPDGTWDRLQEEATGLGVDMPRLSSSTG